MSTVRVDQKWRRRRDSTVGVIVDVMQLYRDAAMAKSVTGVFSLPFPSLLISFLPLFPPFPSTLPFSFCCEASPSNPGIEDLLMAVSVPVGSVGPGHKDSFGVFKAQGLGRRPVSANVVLFLLNKIC